MVTVGGVSYTWTDQGDEVVVGTAVFRRGRCSLTETSVAKLQPGFGIGATRTVYSARQTREACRPGYDSVRPKRQAANTTLFSFRVSFLLSSIPSHNFSYGIPSHNQGFWMQAIQIGILP